MKEQRLTQTEVAAIAGINPSTISNALRGKTTITANLKKIALALNLNPDYLLKEACLEKKVVIDIELYQSCITTVLDVLKKENIKVNNDKIQLLQELLYKAVSYKKLPIQEGSAFTRGIIEHGLHLGIFLQPNKE